MVTLYEYLSVTWSHINTHQMQARCKRTSLFPLILFLRNINVLISDAELSELNVLQWEVIWLQISCYSNSSYQNILVEDLFG
jgi:hypothetical protein